jgi:hypothetical protein
MTRRGRVQKRTTDSFSTGAVTPLMVTRNGGVIEFRHVIKWCMSTAVLASVSSRLTSKQYESGEDCKHPDLLLGVTSRGCHGVGRRYSNDVVHQSLSR